MKEKIYLQKIRKTFERSEILEKLNIQKNDMVFLAGSLIEGEVNVLSLGMGNRRSDIDVFVVTDNIENYVDEDLREKTCNTRFFSIGECNFDVEIYDISLVRKFLDELMEIDFKNPASDSIRIKNIFSFEDNVVEGCLSFIHRLSNSIVIYNEDEYLKLKKMISYTNIYQYIIRCAINYIDVGYEDVLGYLEEEQYELAVHASRRVLLNAVKAYLAYYHITFDREKWIPLLLQNLSEKHVETKKIECRFTEYYFGFRISDRNELRKNAEDILELVNEITDKLQGV